MILNWGKPIIEIAKITDGVIGAYAAIPTPVEDSTKLTPTAGTKKEAPIEGGENEDVKYGKNKYVLEFQIRKAKGRTMPIGHNDGVIIDEYAFRITPEDPTTQGIQSTRGRFHVEDSYDTAGGSVWKYSFDALSPADGGTQIRDYDSSGTATVILSGKQYLLSKAIAAMNSKAGANLSVSASASQVQAAYATLIADNQTAVITAITAA